LGQERRFCTQRWRLRLYEASKFRTHREDDRDAAGERPGDCEPFDVVKHLTTDRLKEKLGL